MKATAIRCTLKTYSEENILCFIFRFALSETSEGSHSASKIFTEEESSHILLQSSTVNYWKSSKYGDSEDSRSLVVTFFIWYGYMKFFKAVNKFD